MQILLYFNDIFTDNDGAPCEFSRGHYGNLSHNV